MVCLRYLLLFIIIITGLYILFSPKYRLLRKIRKLVKKLSKKLFITRKDKNGI